MWFLSGLVMIYVPYPSLSLREKLVSSERIEWRLVDTPPPRSPAPASLELIVRDGVPVWREADAEGAWTIRTAHRSARLAPADAVYARREASRFAGQAATSVERIGRDQWTVAGGFDAHRPLWKVGIGDGAGTVIYISSATGAAVQVTNRHERFWNWLGSVPHWIYPTVLRQDNSAWRQVVIWVSGPCIAAALTGFWIGILRTRTGKRRFKGDRVTPYRGWTLWHHVAGLASGVFLIAWIFSGWLSVDPGRLFGSPEPDKAERAYAANPVPRAAELMTLRNLALSAGLVRFQNNAGLATAAVYGPAGSVSTIALATGLPAPLAADTLSRSARVLVPGERLADARLLTKPDDYWYTVGDVPQLPVLRLRFSDPDRTWLYLEPRTGEVLQRLDTRGRVYRWLFDLLHRWDLGLLLRHYPAREAVIWVASLLGLTTSISAIVLGWRRLLGRGRASRLNAL